MSSEKYYLTGKLALLMTLSLSNNIIISPILLPCIGRRSIYYYIIFYYYIIIIVVNNNNNNNNKKNIKELYT